jgi:hypothetical protein
VLKLLISTAFTFSGQGRRMVSMLCRALRNSHEGSRSNDPSGRVGTPESLPFELNDTDLHLKE